MHQNSQQLYENIADSIAHQTPANQKQHELSSHPNKGNGHSISNEHLYSSGNYRTVYNS